MNAIICHPASLERYGPTPFLAIAFAYGLWVVQSADKKRIELIPNPTKHFPYDGGKSA